MKRRFIKLLSREFIDKLIKKRIWADPIEVERSEWLFYINYLREGMIVFDVGSNIGELTLLFSRFVGKHGKVYSFEASSKAFKRQTDLCEIANRKNLVINHRAVSDTNGIVRLHVYDDVHLGWNSLAKRPLKEYGIDIEPIGIEEVPSVTIDSYCKQNGIAQIDLLKIDVEGAEYQVLQGASWMLHSKKIRCLIFEFGQTTFDMGNKPEEIKYYLRKFGYRIKNVVKFNPVFPGKFNKKYAQFSMHVAKPNS